MSPFDSDTYGRDFEAGLRLLNGNSPEYVFDTLEASAWIKQNVVYTNGAVDINATSVKMGIPVHNGMSELPDSEIFGHAATTGIIDKSEPIEIFLSDTPHHIIDRNASFGHELGHVFLDRKLGVCSLHNLHEERFCDYVGLMISVPDSELDALNEIDAATLMMLSERLGVSHGTIIERLMRLNRIPLRVAYDMKLPIHTNNPYYQGKVVRNAVCLPCINLEDHPLSEDLVDLPTFDLTSFSVNSCLNDSHAHGDSILQKEIHREVNQLHGRWTDDDEGRYTLGS